MFLCRYNNFKEDDLSECKCNPPYSGENAISARSDLNPPSGTYPFSALGHRSHGGTDMKVRRKKLIGYTDIYIKKSFQSNMEVHKMAYLAGNQLIEFMLCLT